MTETDTDVRMAAMLAAKAAAELTHHDTMHAAGSLDLTGALLPNTRRRS